MTPYLAEERIIFTSCSIVPMGLNGFVIDSYKVTKGTFVGDSARSNHYTVPLVKWVQPKFHVSKVHGSRPGVHHYRNQVFLASGVSLHW
jgi:hypothetical protein